MQPPNAEKASRLRRDVSPDQMIRMLANLWYVLFFIALAGNVYGWALTLLRILQNNEGCFARICLFAHVFVFPLGFVLAFLFGWQYGNSDNHRRVMWIWSASVLLFGILGLWDPTKAR